jgi:methionyl-tRNA formyltransferase
VARIGFAGTTAWAAEALRRLAARPELDVAAVLSQPDRPAGRGRRTAPTPVARAGEELGLPVLRPEKPAGALDDLQAAGIEAMALVAYGSLVPRVLLDAFPWLNLHPSLLPRWRGAAPIERALLSGEEELGVAVILLVQALDAGPVAALERFRVERDENAGDAYDRALERGLDPLAQAVEAAAGGTLPTVPQVGEATYAEKLTAADRALDPAAAAAVLHDQVRALSPHIGARLDVGGEAFVVWKTREAAETGLATGQLRVDGARLLLGCGDGALELVELQPPGKKAMPADAWLRGVRGDLPAAASP